MRRRSTILAAVLAAVLILPAGVASAHEKGEHHRVAAVTEEATGLPADVAGTYTWAGDLFGLGVTTTITYTVELDEAGIPAITSISVDEATLPEGAEATVWGPGSGVWERPGDDGEPVIKFASRAGVAVQFDDQRAGVLVKVRGFAGDDPSATVKSVAIAAPVVEEEPEETPVVVIEDPSDDPEETDDEAADDEERDRRGDKDRRDKDRHGDKRGKHRGWDVGWGDRDGDRWDHDDHGRDDRGGDDRGERRSGKGDGREDCDPDERRDSDDHEDRGDRGGKDHHDDDEVSGGESDGGELDGDDSSDEEDQEL